MGSFGCTNNFTHLSSAPSASLMDIASSANDSETVNYTGAAISAPTGFTNYSSNKTVTATNTATEPTTGSFTTTGFIADTINATTFGNGLPIDSISSGTWTFTIPQLGTGLLGPTAKIGIRAWQVSSDLTAKTVINLGTSNANRWVYTSTFTAASTLTITASGTGIVNMNSNSKFLYIEILLDITTGGTNVVANAITLNNISFTLPAISFSRSQTETVGAASIVNSRTFVGSRSQTETAGPSDVTNTRIYTANRTQTETITTADITISRVFNGARTQSENVSANVVNSRTFNGSRSQTETVVPADVVNSRIANFNRSISEDLAASSTTLIISVNE